MCQRFRRHRRRCCDPRRREQSTHAPGLSSIVRPKMLISQQGACKSRRTSTTCFHLCRPAAAMSYRFSSASPNRGGGFLGFSATTASGGVKATLQLPEREARGATLTFDSSSGAATAGVNLVQRGMSRRLRGSDHGGHLHVGLGSRGVVTVGGAGAAVQEFLPTGTVRGDDLAASTTLVCRNTLSLGAHINESRECCCGVAARRQAMPSLVGRESCRCQSCRCQSCRCPSCRCQSCCRWDNASPFR